MQPNTRLMFRAYALKVAVANSVSSATAEQFNVIPAIEQRLEAAIQLESSFLRSINIEGVRDIKGEVVYGGVTGTIAGRTDTSGSGERNPRDVTSLSSLGYECVQTDYDTGFPYARLDAWSSKPNFQALISAQIVSQTALDRIMIGWNGTSRAATTNRVTNPLLQDVNKGWIQKYVDHSPERVMTAGATPGVIKVGGTSPDYQNIDALVYQAAAEMLHPRFVNSSEIMAMVGQNLLDEKYFPLINQDHKPTEYNALDMVMASKKLGGYRVVVVPFLPAGTIVITAPKNLSIYYQTGSRRRQLIDEPKKNRYANYESVNEDFVVEEFPRGCVIKNIQFGGVL